MNNSSSFNTSLQKTSVLIHNNIDTLANERNKLLSAKLSFKKKCKLENKNLDKMKSDLEKEKKALNEAKELFEKEKIAFNEAKELFEKEKTVKRKGTRFQIIR